MKKMLLFLIVISMILTSCRTFSGKGKAQTAADVKKGMVLIVGKVEFDPPMTMETQNISITALEMSEENIRLKTFMICDTELGEKVRKGDSDVSKGIEATQGETFYALRDDKSFYIVKGIIFKEFYYTPRILDRKIITLPASFYVKIAPGDRAVYIGTIKYKRDNFWQVGSIEIKDDYEKELAVFNEKFAGLQLKKALIRQPEKGVIPEIGAYY